jgi:hypothetical protein
MGFIHFYYITYKRFLELLYCPKLLIFQCSLHINYVRKLIEKLKAMECYKSEIREYPHPRSLKALEIIAARWGTVVGKTYVEAFELIRKVV